MRHRQIPVIEQSSGITQCGHRHPLLRGLCRVSESLREQCPVLAALDGQNGLPGDRPHQGRTSRARGLISRTTTLNDQRPTAAPDSRFAREYRRVEPRSDARPRSARSTQRSGRSTTCFKARALQAPTTTPSAKRKEHQRASKRLIQDSATLSRSARQRPPTAYNLSLVVLPVTGSGRSSQRCDRPGAR
jgi:hypothetical protein